MLNAIANAMKKDDDIRIVQDTDNELYVETTVPLLFGEAEDADSVSLGDRIKQTIASDTVLEDSINDPLPDIRVQSISFIFMGNSTVQFLWFIIASPLYYWNNVSFFTLNIVFLSVFSTLFFVFYCLMLWNRKTNDIIALISLGCWAISGGICLGTIANLVHNIGPVQFVLILLMQSFTVLAYTKLSPRFIRTLYAMTFMFIATLLVWAFFIFVFVEQHDWVEAIIILVLSFAAIAYHGWQIRIVEGRYNVSWDDIRVSIIQFYGDPVLFVINKLCQK